MLKLKSVPSAAFGTLQEDATQKTYRKKRDWDLSPRNAFTQVDNNRQSEHEFSSFAIEASA